MNIDGGINVYTAASAVDEEDSEGSLTLQQPETVEATPALEAPGMPDALAGALLSDELHTTATAAGSAISESGG